MQIACQPEAMAAARELVHAISGQPMLAEEAWLDGILAATLANPSTSLQANIGGGQSAQLPQSEGEQELSWFTGRYDYRSRYNVTDDGIGIVRVHGLLLARGPWLGSIWGMTTYEGLAEQFKRLAADDQVRHVVLDVNSGGGQAAGIWDLMPVLDELKSKKRVYAIANPFAASAAYAIACGAHEFHIAHSGLAGSIGVIRPHMDYSGMFERMGIRPTTFKAGRFKDAASQLTPLSNESRDYIQDGVDQMYDDFVAHVAHYRGMDPDAVRNTEARVYSAADAVDCGLADGISSFEELIDKVRNPRSAPSRAKPPSSGGSMTTAPTGAGLSTADLERISASVATLMNPPAPAASAQASDDRSDTVPKAEAETMAKDAAAKAVAEDRARTKAVLELPEAKGHEARALKLAHDTEMSVDDIKSFLSDLPKAMTESGASGFGHALAAAMSQSGTSGQVKPDAASGGTVDSMSANLPSLGEVITARFVGSNKSKRS